MTEHLPLDGVRVVVTRSSAQASKLSEALISRGATPIEFATIQIVPPVDEGLALREAVARLSEYDWVVLTSVNAVDAYVAAGSAGPGGPRLAAVGERTRIAAESAGCTVELVPSTYVAASLVEAFPDGAGKVLYPCGSIAGATIDDGLAAKGWLVDRVEAYRTIAAEAGADELEAVRSADVVTFASSSSAAWFCELVGVDALPGTIVCIGPVTASTATENGLRVDRVADPHTIEGLVDAVVAEWDDKSR